MSAPLDLRIRWIHRQIFEKHYPNAYRVSEKFGISHRQAQRDIEYLRSELKAPIEYDGGKKGFYYSVPFSLPSYSTKANDEDYSQIISKIKNKGGSDVGESETIQLQIPYSAEIAISNKLGVLALKDFIVKPTSKTTFLCEFHSIDLFLGMLFTLDADVTIISPSWLKDKANSCAKRFIENNKNDEEQEI